MRYLYLDWYRCAIYIPTGLDVLFITRKLKCAMFDIQSMGENEEWTAKNFILNKIYQGCEVQLDKIHKSIWQF